MLLSPHPFRAKVSPIIRPGKVLLYPPRSSGVSSETETFTPHGRNTTPYPPLPGALGFRWGFPYLLPTPLSIRQEASRVRIVGLRRDNLGGALLDAPSALCGFPIVIQGSSGLPGFRSMQHPWFCISGLTLRHRWFSALIG